MSAAVEQQPAPPVFARPLPEAPVEVNAWICGWNSVDIDPVPEVHAVAARAVADAAPDDSTCARGPECVGASPALYVGGVGQGDLYAAPIGWGLEGDADEFCRWRTPWLVLTVEGVSVAVCEDCLEEIDPPA